MMFAKLAAFLLVGLMMIGTAAAASWYWWDTPPRSLQNRSTDARVMNRAPLLSNMA